MIKAISILLGLTFLAAPVWAQKTATAAAGEEKGTTVLYKKVLDNKSACPELLLNDVDCKFTENGLVVTGKNNIIQLNKYYSLGERMVRYVARFSKDAKAVFQSNTGDTKLVINVPEQKVMVATTPEVWKRMTIEPDTDYLIEIQRIYQKTKIVIADLTTGNTETLEIAADGSGGVGAGELHPAAGMLHHWDKYCFGLLEGTALTVKQIIVQSLACDLTLLMYGDSITQPEGYFPAAAFYSSWTQLIMQQVKGKAMSSGRGGCTINEVLERIKNELPFLKAKYVMVTIGTNGGNTEEKLSELVEYIISNGSIPLLNNIPSNERGSQIQNNLLIDNIRKKYNINGCRFDLATSLKKDGREVDRSTMWHEDYTAINQWGHIFHHPNVKGSRLMYLQTLIDTPEIYE